MTTGGSDRAIIASALIVTTIYAFRYFTEIGKKSKTETETKEVHGEVWKIETIVGAGGKLAPPPQFAISMGFVFFILSLVGMAAPTVGGTGAILVAVTDALINGQAIMADISRTQGKQVKTEQKK